MEAAGATFGVVAEAPVVRNCCADDDHHDRSGRNPRVSGTEIQDGMRFIIGKAFAASGGIWVAEEATLTNDGGSWTGSAQAIEDGGSRPIREAHYFGEGAYEGLDFHCYFCVGPYDGAQRFHGWISSQG